MMDALEFIKAIKQMLSAEASNSTVQKYISAYKKNDCEGIVEAAEQWAAEHPTKTRQSVFLEQYPEAQADIDDVLCVCHAVMSLSYRDDVGVCLDVSKRCANCRREFWLAEVEDV